MSLASFFSLLGGDWGIQQTARAIQGLVSASLRDPNAQIRLRAERIIGGTQERAEDSEVNAVYDWVVSHFHYVQDPAGLEMVKTPQLMDMEVQTQGEFKGDCDDATAYLAALLVSIGYPVMLVVAAPNDGEGFDYRHIYLRVWKPQKGVWFSLDPTAKSHGPGWEVPHTRERRYEVRP